MLTSSNDVCQLKVGVVGIHVRGPDSQLGKGTNITSIILGGWLSPTMIVSAVFTVNR